MHPTKVIGISLNTYDMTEEAARRACEAATRETGLPATDPVRFDPLLCSMRSSTGQAGVPMRDEREKYRADGEGRQGMIHYPECRIALIDAASHAAETQAAFCSHVLRRRRFRFPPTFPSPAVRPHSATGTLGAWVRGRRGPRLTIIARAAPAAS